MAHRNGTPSFHGNPLLLGIVISLVVHLLIATFGSPFQLETKKLTPTMTVELQPPKAAPPPPPPPEPEPPKPEPPKPLPKKVTPPPVRTPLPPPREERVNAPPPTVTPPPPPQVIAAAPVEDTKPSFTAPPSESEKPHAPQPTVDIDADLSNYGNLLAREFAKNKKYPRIAQMRGWQGKPSLEIHIDKDGKITSINVKTRSDYEALDKAAIETVQRTTLPAIPEALRGKEFTLTVPFDFKLE